MGEPKRKPERREAGRSKFRLPDRQPRAGEVNPLRELLREARAQEEEAQQLPAAPATPASHVAGVVRAPDAAPREAPARKVAGAAGPVKPPRDAGERAPAPFGEFSKRWAPILRSGQMSVCRVLFEMTHGAGEAECFTSMPKLAAAAGLKERQCYNVVAQLEQLGFVERPDIFNTPTKKGTVFRLFLSPRDPAPAADRRYHIGGGD
jgi:hypothetical protein